MQHCCSSHYIQSFPCLPLKVYQPYGLGDCMPVLMELSQHQKLQVECRVKVLLNMLLLMPMCMHTGIQSAVCECPCVHPSVISRGFATLMLLM